MKRWVLRRFLKTDIDDVDVTFCGRMFHSREASTGKARSPMVDRLKDGCVRRQAMMTKRSLQRVTGQHFKVPLGGSSDVCMVTRYCLPTK